MIKDSRGKHIYTMECHISTQDDEDDDHVQVQIGNQDDQNDDSKTQIGTQDDEDDDSKAQIGTQDDEDDDPRPRLVPKMMRMMIPRLTTCHENLHDNERWGDTFCAPPPT